MELARLREQVARLQDRADIQDLFARYGFYADHGAVEAWLDLFLPDAFMHVPDYSRPGSAATTRLTGRDALRTGIVDNPKVQALRGRSQHYMLGPATFELHGREAVVDSYGYVLIVPEPDAAGGPTPSPTFNRWILRRTEDGWRIAGCVRRQVAQSALPLSEIASRANPQARVPDQRPATQPAAAYDHEAAERVHGWAVQRINHVAVSVRDIDTSIAFYTELLGLEVVATQPRIQDIPGMCAVAGYPEDRMDGSWALLAGGPSRLELVSYRWPEGTRPDDLRAPADLGLAHLAFQVADVDAMHARLVAAGVPTRSAPITLGRHRAFYAYGPDGELLELLEEYSATPPSAPLG
jgi:catechol 2,3-dioxygenase-like lactoylglutathione lyase family enzyme